MQAALDIIDKIIEEPEVDKVYEGTVVKIVDFGAFVNILPGKDGLLLFQKSRKKELRMFQQFCKKDRKLQLSLSVLIGEK